MHSCAEALHCKRNVVLLVQSRHRQSAQRTHIEKCQLLPLHHKLAGNMCV